MFLIHYIAAVLTHVEMLEKYVQMCRRRRRQNKNEG